jgi:hypothetical protein
MENDKPQPALPLPAAGFPAAGQQHQIKLLPFWTENPVAWCHLAEGQFALHNVIDPITRYDHMLAALSTDSVRLVRHVLHVETGPDFYDQLRTSLMASHSLSNYQKMERMMRLPPLSDRKPTVLLAEMLEFCPAGESSTAVFAFLFLQCLPREIRVLLSQDDPADMRLSPRRRTGSSPCTCCSLTIPAQQLRSHAWWRRGRRLGIARPRATSAPSRRLWAAASTSAREARSRRPPCARLCATTMPNSANRRSSVRKGASGQKTRSPGCCFGNSPRSPLLCDGQFVSSLISGWQGLRFLHHVLAVLIAAHGARIVRGRRSPHSLLGRAAVHSHHWWSFSPVDLSPRRREFPHPGD